MSEEPKPRLVRDVEVTCFGPRDAPHPPRVLALPPDTAVRCEDCGLRYRRAFGWESMTRAHWPKPE